jgi:small-conductance mechanosensitive channel
MVTYYDLWQEAVTRSLIDLWTRLINFLPFLVGALAVFILGWIVAVGLGRLVTKILVLLRINEAFEKISGLRSTLERAGLDLNVPRFLGEIVKWFLIIVALMAAADILQLEAVSSFLNDVIAYIPQIVIAAIILVIGAVFGNFVYRVTRSSVSAAQFSHSGTIASTVKWAVYIFAILAALAQLGIAEEIIRMLLTGFIAMLALAGGLAFGLGGKDAAAEVIARLKQEFTERQ